MRFLVISDIHSNIESLSALVKVIESVHYDQVIFCGDLAGYATDVDLCVEALHALEPIAVCGNHDEMLCSDDEPLGFNNHAMAAIEWQRLNSSATAINYCRDLPKKAFIKGSFGEGIIVHGSPFDRYEYLSGSNTFSADFAASFMINENLSIALVGHTHAPGLFVFSYIKELSQDLKNRVDDDGLFNIYYEIEKFRKWFPAEGNAEMSFKPEDTLIINAGSTGQPRDRDPRGCFVVLDDEKLKIEFHRYEYDISKTQAKIRKAGLPDFIASRLVVGR